MHGSPARTETFVLNQLRTLRRYRPVVVCHHRRDGSDLPMGAGVEVADVVSRRVATVDALAYRFTRQTLPPATAALGRYITRENARLIHYHFVTDARFFLALQRRTGLPTVVSAYGYDVSSFPTKAGGLAGRYLRPAFRRLDLFLAMSDDMRRDLVAIGCPEEKIRIHYHGIDTIRFAFPERTQHDAAPPMVLLCGALVRKKAQHLVLRALRAVEAGGLGAFRVLIVGDGPMRAELEAMVAEFGWRDRVRFAGHVPHGSDELLAAYRGSDVFALPSITAPNGQKEGIPGVIVEAMASGLPVVASLHAGIPAVVEHERTGLLAAEGDVPALAVALRRLLADHHLRERLGRAGAERALGELDVRPATAALERIYDDLIAGVLPVR